MLAVHVQQIQNAAVVPSRLTDIMTCLSDILLALCRAVHVWSGFSADCWTRGTLDHWWVGGSVACNNLLSHTYVLLVHAACICWLSSHCVDTAKESHSLPGPPAAEMNFVIFPFAFFAGGIIPLVSTCLHGAGCSCTLRTPLPASWPLLRACGHVP